MDRLHEKVRIHTIDFGFNQCYLIQGEGVVMVDGGPPNSADTFVRALNSLPVEPDDIELIVLTHGHFDHIGSVADIKEITGAKIAMHHLDRECLERPLNRMPRGVGVWGCVLRLTLPAIVRFARIRSTGVDLVLGDEGMSLSDCGIQGRVVFTPGHTVGSISVLLDSGDAFVGCMVQNKFPLRLRPGLPVLAEDIDGVRDSWRNLLELGAERIYPGHGKPFSIEIVRKALRGPITDNRHR
jgi:glyoxylase-like metal-dependent hydrolase (beta-lactamase superfamily II)